MHKNALLLVNRGVIHQFMGDVVNAMNDYQEAVIIEPSYSLAHFNIGNILFQQRHFKQVRVPGLSSLIISNCYAGCE